MYKWIDKSNINIVTKINEFKCKVQNINQLRSLSFTHKWDRYRDCEEYIQKLSGYLVDKYPNQIGGNIYKEFNSIKPLSSN